MLALHALILLIWHFCLVAEPGLRSTGCDPVYENISFGCRRWKSKGSLRPPLTSDSAKGEGILLYQQLVTKGHTLSEEENQLPFIKPRSRAAVVELKALSRGNSLFKGCDGVLAEQTDEHPDREVWCSHAFDQYTSLWALPRVHNQEALNPFFWGVAYETSLCRHVEFCHQLVVIT